MLVPSLRGRIIALEIFFLSSWSSIQSRVLIAVKSTRFDEGHVIAWFIEQDGYNRHWPTSIHLDPSILDSSNDSHKHSLGIVSRHSLEIGSVPMCLDDLKSICYRAPLPDNELGEDQYSWCLDVLFKMERNNALSEGETLKLEHHIAKARTKMDTEEASYPDNLKALPGCHKPVDHTSLSIMAL